MKKAKYKKGQQVVYNGLIGVIVGITKNMDGAIMYDLEAQLDCKLSCTALESLCELYVDQDINQKDTYLTIST